MLGKIMCVSNLWCFNKFAIHQQMQVLIHLFFNSFCYRRMPVANIAYAYAGNEVNK